jgi:hypothetical protein
VKSRLKQGRADFAFLCDVVMAEGLREQRRRSSNVLSRVHRSRHLRRRRYTTWASTAGAICFVAGVYVLGFGV